MVSSRFLWVEWLYDPFGRARRPAFLLLVPWLSVVNIKMGVNLESGRWRMARILVGLSMTGTLRSVTMISTLRFRHSGKAASCPFSPSTTSKPAWRRVNATILRIETESSTMSAVLAMSIRRYLAELEKFHVSCCRERFFAGAGRGSTLAMV